MALPADGWVILVMGVAGSGKTTIGRALAAELGARFFDADDYHSPENIRKMAHAEALTDADRAPWLEALRQLVAGVLQAQQQAVLACSALKRSYRDAIGVDARRMPVVFLDGSPELIARRLRERVDHFAPPALLGSQLATLEKPEDAIHVDVSQPPEAIIRSIRERLGVPPR
jgi:gluconokinase